MIGSRAPARWRRRPGRTQDANRSTALGQDPRSRHRPHQGQRIQARAQHPPDQTPHRGPARQRQGDHDLLTTTNDTQFPIGGGGNVHQRSCVSRSFFCKIIYSRSKQKSTIDGVFLFPPNQVRAGNSSGSGCTLKQSRADPPWPRGEAHVPPCEWVATSLLARGPSAAFAAI